MFPVKLIHEQAYSAGLEYLLIGGHALNAYGIPRATVDVDILDRKTDREKWMQFLDREGFKIQNDGGNFIQTTPPYAIEWPLDLMFVNNETFAKLRADSRKVDILNFKTRVPGPLHLLALKLHSLTHGPPARKPKDFADIVVLATAAELKPRDPETKAVFEKHGNPEIYEEFLRAISA